MEQQHVVPRRPGPSRPGPSPNHGTGARPMPQSQIRPACPTPPQEGTATPLCSLPRSRLAILHSLSPCLQPPPSPPSVRSPLLPALSSHISRLSSLLLPLSSLVSPPSSLLLPSLVSALLRHLPLPSLLSLASSLLSPPSSLRCPRFLLSRRSPLCSLLSPLSPLSLGPLGRLRSPRFSPLPPLSSLLCPASSLISPPSALHSSLSLFLFYSMATLRSFLPPHPSSFSGLICQCDPLHLADERRATAYLSSSRTYN